MDSLESSGVCSPGQATIKGRMGDLEVYLCSLLRGPRLALGERRRRGFLALLGRLSLRKEDHQRIIFTKYDLL